MVNDTCLTNHRLFISKLSKRFVKIVENSSVFCFSLFLSACLSLCLSLTLCLFVCLSPSLPLSYCIKCWYLVLKKGKKVKETYSQLINQSKLKPNMLPPSPPFPSPPPSRLARNTCPSHPPPTPPGGGGRGSKSFITHFADGAAHESEKVQAEKNERAKL